MTTLEIYSQMGDGTISFIEFAVSLQGWDVRPLHHDGELAALIKFKGPEFHLWTSGRHSFSRREIKAEVFEPLFLEYGFARTITPKSDARQQRFNERIGFQRIGEDDQNIHYQIDKGAI